MTSRFTAGRTKPKGVPGFTAVELLISIAVITVISAVSFPTFFRMLQSYQLNSAASQVASILKATRYEAIRRNTPASCIVVQASATNSTLWIDADGDGVQDPTETAVALPGSSNFVASGIPGAATLTNAVQSGVLNTVAPSSSNTSFAFDPRGALTGANANTVYALYLNNVASPSAGYRAVILLPSGAVQIWFSDSAGNWQPAG